MSEEWRPVVGYEGRYEVSSLGRVRSLDTVAPCRGGKRQRRPGRLLSPGFTRGYPYVQLHDGSPGRHRGSPRLVHRLVLGAFVGPCPGGMEACHWNGDEGDPRLANLRWATSQENKADMRRHGRSGRRLTEAAAHEIRRRYLRGETTVALGVAFGISSASVSRIGRGKQWAAERGVPIA